MSLYHDVVGSSFPFATLSHLKLVVGIIPLTVISLALYRLYFHPLRKVPGPFLARITELWRSTHYFRGTWFIDIVELHRKYGPVVRISPNEVSVVSPDLTKTIYSHHKGTVKTDWYNVWSTMGGGVEQTGIFHSTDPKEHGFLRKRVSTVYSLSSIISLEPKVQGVMNSLWEKLDEFEQKKEPVNISLWASYFAYDVVGTLCLSKPMGFISAGGDHTGLVDSIHWSFYWLSNIGFLPFKSRLLFNPVSRVLDRIFRLRIAGNLGAFMDFAGDKVSERMKGPRAGMSDMLDHFLDMKDRQGQPAGIMEVYAEMGNVLAAGADTTSVGIKAVLGPLLRDPLRYRRLQAELDEVYKNFGAGAGQPIFYSILKDLPYLDACIKEGCRLHPSIVYQLPRKSPSGGVELEGFFIGPSSTISMSPLAQNRSKAIFGDDANEWKPERWIVGELNTEDQIRYMDKNLATFGYGSRTCIGRNLANVEMTKFVAEILTRYDVELLNPAQPWSIFSQWFAEINNMMVRLHKRGEKTPQN
ncbi:hypothetical protein GQX73_g9664 [Xylaria multiplex]|uniref:Cytochrome P450 n=1 Tax=Xylaria multiplex TaxID=323545 RepID=A0A7C8MYF3_9PEZI|nr:hypothetical protein GQX73_g9664 [Xylaria multiplex]